MFKKLLIAVGTIFVMVLGFSAFRGHIYPVSEFNTVAGLNMVKAGCTGTFVLQSPLLQDGGRLFMLAWPEGQSGINQAFLVLSSNTGQPVKDFLLSSEANGNMVSPRNMKEVTDFLISKGWAYVPAATLPEVITQGIVGSYSTLFNIYQRAMPTILIVPAGWFEDKPWEIQNTVGYLWTY